jgi:tRNA(Phe) wybutosine-synthesizing methylase Tyw3
VTKREYKKKLNALTNERDKLSILIQKSNTYLDNLKQNYNMLGNKIEELNNKYEKKPDQTSGDD